MISPIDDFDYEEILALATVAIREAVASTGNEASAIISVVKDSLVEWRKNKTNSFHSKFTLKGKIVGYLILK